MIRLRLLRASFASLALFTLAGLARADDGTKAIPTIAQTAAPIGTVAEDSSLTWNGITFYGKIDVGIANQTHGAPFNSNSSQGLNYLIAKNSNNSITSRAANGLGQSAFGLNGDIALGDRLSAIFKLEAGFNPLSLRLSNGPQSLVDNNGRSLTSQTSYNDSSRAGQLW